MTFSDGMIFDQPRNKSSSQGHGPASSLQGRGFATAGDFQFQKQEVENAFVHVLINNEARAELFLNAFEERRTRPWLPEGAEEATSALAGAIRTAITVWGLELPQELRNWDRSRGDTNGTSSGYKISERDLRAALNLALTGTALREFEQAAELTPGSPSSPQLLPELLKKHAENALLAYVKNSDAGSSPDPW